MRNTTPIINNYKPEPEYKIQFWEKVKKISKKKFLYLNLLFTICFVSGCSTVEVSNSGVYVPEKHLVKVETPSGSALIEFTHISNNKDLASAYRWKYKKLNKKDEINGNGYVVSQNLLKNTSSINIDNIIEAGPINVTWAYANQASYWIYHTNHIKLELVNKSSFEEYQL